MNKEVSNKTHVKLEYDDGRNPIVVDVDHSRFRDDEFETDLENAIDIMLSDGDIPDADNVVGWDVLTEKDYEEFKEFYGHPDAYECLEDEEYDEDEEVDF